MKRLRIAAAAATIIFVLAVFAYLAMRLGWRIDRTAIICTMVISASVAAVTWCTAVVLKTLHDAMVEILDGLATETKALHRSLVTGMEQYGDERAIGAVVAVQQRRAVNDSSRRCGEQTTDLGTRYSGNVTPIRNH